MQNRPPHTYFFEIYQNVGERALFTQLFPTSADGWTFNRKKSAKNHKNHKKLTETTVESLVRCDEMPMFAANGKHCSDGTVCQIPADDRTADRNDAGTVVPQIRSLLSPQHEATREWSHLRVRRRAEGSHQLDSHPGRGSVLPVMEPVIPSLSSVIPGLTRNLKTMREWDTFT